MKPSLLIHLNFLLALLIEPTSTAPMLMGAWSVHSSHEPESRHIGRIVLPDDASQSFRDEGQLDPSRKVVSCAVEEYAIPVFGKVAWNFEMSVIGWGHGGAKDLDCGSGIEANLRSSCKGAVLRIYTCKKLEENKLEIRFQTSKVHIGQCIDEALHHASYRTWSARGPVCPFHYGLSIFREVGYMITWVMLIVGLPCLRSSTRMRGWLKGLAYTAVLVVVNNAFDNWDRWFKAAASSRKAGLEAKSDTAKRQREAHAQQVVNLELATKMPMGSEVAQTPAVET